MQTSVIAVPTYDLGQCVVDQMAGNPLTVVWQVPLTGFYTRQTRMDSVAGVAVLISQEHGVLAPGAEPPNLNSDLWPVPVRMAGSASAGQVMLVDQSSMVYRFAPGQAPIPVWRSNAHPSDVDVIGLPDGRLLSCYDDDARQQTNLIDEASGCIVWSSPLTLAPTLVVGEQLIGYSYGAADKSLVSLDAGTGEQRWRRDKIWPSPDLIAVVGDVAWTDQGTKLMAFDVQTGTSTATISLPRQSRRIGVLDQAGHMHIVDEEGWTVVDLVNGQVVADTRFDAPGMGRVYAGHVVRTADGRLVLADDCGQVFVVYPDRPNKPDLVTTCPEIQCIGTAAGCIIVLCYDGTLTALGSSIHPAAVPSTP